MAATHKRVPAAVASVLVDNVLAACGGDVDAALLREILAAAAAGAQLPAVTPASRMAAMRPSAMARHSSLPPAAMMRS